LAGAGAVRGLPGGARPSAGGWRTGNCVRRREFHGPGDVVQRRVPGAGRTGDRSPRVFRPAFGAPGADGQGRTGQRPGGRGVPFPGTGRTCVAPRGRIRWPVRRRRTRLRLPGGSARCTGQSAGGRGENRRASKSGGGRSCTVGGEPGRPMSAGKVGMARGPSRRSRSPGEGGDRSRRARGVRRTASGSWLLWSRITAWNASIGSLGERAPGGARGPGSSRRQGRSPDRAGQGVTPCLDQSGRHRRHRGLHRPAGGP
jgi:hypothetical protein